MSGGDGTGPAGQGPGIGRSNESKELCKGRNAKASGGPGGICICPQCGFKTPHQPGVPCIQVICERCGSPMNRK